MAKPLPKLLTVAALAFIASTTSSFALSGGPWDYNVADGNQADGVHSVAMSGKNMVGVAMINASGTSSTGSFIVFREGQIIAGNAFAIFDTPGRKVAGVFEGATPLILADIGEDGGGVAEIGGIPVIAADSITIVRIPGAAGGSYEGDITSTGPNFTWDGSGNFVFTESDEDGSTVSVEVDFTVHGVRTSLTPPTTVGFFNSSSLSADVSTGIGGAGAATN